MNPVDLVLARLDGFKLRQNGKDRWRACCPAHGGKNPSALSVGVGQDGQVLLRCWHGCDIEQVVAALGLSIEDLFPPRPDAGGGCGQMKRRRLITAAQALDVLDIEMTLAIVVMSDFANGVAPDEATRDRLLLGAARVALIRKEVHA